MKRLFLTEEQREQLLPGKVVVVRRAMKPQPGELVNHVGPGFDGDRYWRDHWRIGRYDGQCYAMLPARKPPYTPDDVAYVPEAFFIPRCPCCDDGDEYENCLCGHVYTKRRTAALGLPVPSIAWRSPALMPAWAARTFARCVGVRAEKGERWEWVLTFEQCERGGE